MNFSKNKIFLKATNPDNKDLELEIEAQGESIKEEGQKLGFNMASEKQPALIGAKLDICIEPLRSRCRKLARYKDKVLQSNSIDLEIERDKTHTKEEIETRESLSSEANHRRKGFITQLEKIVIDFNFKLKVPTLFALLLLAISQIFLDSSSFQSFQINRITSYILATGIGIAVIAISHNILKILDLVDHTYQKIFLFLGVNGVFAITFYIVANLRSAFSQAMQVSNSNAQIASFVGINMIMGLASLVLAFFGLPSSKNELKREKQIELEDKIKSYDKEIIMYAKEIKVLKDDLFDRTEIRESHLRYSNDLQSYIETIYENAVGAFQSANSTSRTDGIPDCFEQEIPPLFNNQKK